MTLIRALLGCGCHRGSTENNVFVDDAMLSKPQTTASESSEECRRANWVGMAPHDSCRCGDCGSNAQADSLDRLSRQLRGLRDIPARGFAGGICTGLAFVKKA